MFFSFIIKNNKSKKKLFSVRSTKVSIVFQKVKLFAYTVYYYILYCVQIVRVHTGFRSRETTTTRTRTRACRSRIFAIRVKIAIRIS